MVLGTMYGETTPGETTPVNDLVNLVGVFKYIKEKYIKEKRESSAFQMKTLKLQNSCIS